MPSVTDVADRLEQAAHTLRRMPKVTVQGYKSTWPEVVRDFMDAYGWDGTRVRLGPPTARQISEMDEALRWMLWLNAYEAKLVWLRACRVRWKAIEWKLGFSRAKLSSDWNTAIIQITLTVNLSPASDDYPYKKELILSRQNSRRHYGQISTQNDIGSRNVRAGRSEAFFPEKSL